jgi:glutaminyl-peptide cyclotransferase
MPPRRTPSRRSAPRRADGRRRSRIVAVVAGVAALAAVAYVAMDATPRNAAPAAAAVRQATPVYGFDVVHEYPHDPQAFTQGLIFRDGYLYESTGQLGHSTLRKVELETGKVIERRRVDDKYFAEGLTDWGSRLVQLTWQSNIGFVYDLATFKPLSTFSYRGEGWGLTHDDRRLIMSDGTSNLRFLDPDSLQEQSRVGVKDGAVAIQALNELEFVKGLVYANVWLTDQIAIIRPESGEVTGWVNLAGLLRPSSRTGGEDVLNGIAYDAAADRLFVTGKYWPKLFEIRVRTSTGR